MKKMFIIILLITVSILISPVIAIDSLSIRTPVIYRDFIDQYGVSKIYETYNVTYSKAVLYQNGTLNIYKGDTIIWINYADKRLTIMSEQNLWNNESGILTEYKELNYTFTKYGIYNIYIKEFPNLKQKIIVGPIEQISKNVTSANNTKPLTIKSNSTNTNIKKQDSTINKSIPISISDKIKSRLDTIILTVVLLSMYVLSGRIKED